MIKRFGISVPVAALLALSLTLFSCSREEEPRDTVHPEITIDENPVSTKAGSQFVHVKAGGEWTLSIDYGDGEKDWASFDTPTGKGSAPNVKFRYTENKSESSRYLTVRIKSGGGSSDITFRQYGTKDKLVLTGGYGDAMATQGWLELPATDASDGLEFFTHYAKIGVRNMRNFSYYYSYSDLDAVWVAYPLNKGLIGSNIGRTDEWAYDPLLPEAYQQYVLESYGNGYSRGHQIPSADRYGTVDRNAQTFYATNMTPQDYDFNGGPWVALENSVRDLARTSDTLYVVTGAMLGSKYTYDRKGNKITVPDAYFKALLFYGNSGRYNGFSAVGVYMEHKSTLPGSLIDYAMSIEELEARTGLTFFVNLPGKVGSESAKKIKSQSPSWLPETWNKEL